MLPTIRKVVLATRRFSTAAPADGKDLQKAFLRAVSGTDTVVKSNIIVTPIPLSSPVSVNTSNSKAVFSSANSAKPVKFENNAEAITLPKPVAKQSDLLEFAPKIVVIGVGGGGCNAVNNMIARGLSGVRFVCANTDAQHLVSSLAETRLQLGKQVTQGLGCGANPAVG